MGRDIPRQFSWIWNDMPQEQRERLAPAHIQDQILHLEQSRQMIVRGHNKTLRELDDWIGNLKRELARYCANCGGKVTRECTLDTCPLTQGDKSNG